MDLASNTVLITGGASGIGFALAERFVRAGSEVIVCGRREDKLREAKDKRREITIRVGDIETVSGRRSLFNWAVAEFPQLNVLVNNAGIQRRGVRLADTVSDAEWERTRQEIAVNFEAPVHLSRLFVPHLLKQKRAA